METEQLQNFPRGPTLLYIQDCSLQEAVVYTQGKEVESSLLSATSCCEEDTDQDSSLKVQTPLGVRANTGNTVTHWDFF